MSSYALTCTFLRNRILPSGSSWSEPGASVSDTTEADATCQPGGLDGEPPRGGASLQSYCPSDLRDRTGGFQKSLSPSLPLPPSLPPSHPSLPPSLHPSLSPSLLVDLSVPLCPVYLSVPLFTCLSSYPSAYLSLFHSLFSWASWAELQTRLSHSSAPSKNVVGRKANPHIPWIGRKKNHVSTNSRDSLWLGEVCLARG